MYTTENIPISVQHSIVACSIAAVKAFVSKYFPNFFTKEDVEDIAGNVNYKVCRSISKYNPKYALSTWIGTISRNCVYTAADEKRKRLPISQAMFLDTEEGEELSYAEFGGYRGDEFEADRELYWKEFQSELKNAARDFSDKDSKVFKMLMDGDTPKEIAKKLGVNANAAAIRSCNVRKALKEPCKKIASDFGISCGKLAG